MYKKTVRVAAVLLLGLSLNVQGQGVSERLGEGGRFSAPLSGFLKHRLDEANPEYDPLLSITNIVIPETEKTVLDAMVFVLDGTSYDINSSVVNNPTTAEIVKKEIPKIQREMRGVTKLEALKYLIGQHHIVLIDPVLRQVGFDLEENIPSRVE